MGVSLQIAVVVPCFNEASRWQTEYWSELTSDADVTWVFVNDGSKDSTAQLLDEICKLKSHCSVLHLQRNLGKALAVRMGFLHLFAMRRFDVVSFMDADGAFAGEEFARLLRCAEEKLQVGEWDSVWTSRVALAGRDIQRSLLRHYLGRLVATFVSIGTDSLPYDTQSGLKFFAVSDDLIRCFEAPFLTRWLFDLELINRWRTIVHRPMQIWEEPLMSWKEVEGSRVTRGEFVRIARELSAIKRQQFSSKSGAFGDPSQTGLGR